MKLTPTIFLLIIGLNIVCAQGFTIGTGPCNPLSISEFKNIELNGITVQRIQETNGLQQEVEALFGQVISEHDGGGDNEFRWSSYTSDGLGFYFEDYDHDGNYDLQGFDMSAANGRITIKGTSLTLGDPISKLGSNIIFSRNKNGSQTIVYRVKNSAGEFWEEFIYIDFDQESKLITAIGYVVPT